MDASEPPRIVVQSHGSCSDTSGTEALLRDALARSRAPGHAWAVTMRVQPTAGHTLRANGEITDGSGLEVASRELSVPAGVDAGVGCEGLARAVGVWASLVLDEEWGRAQAASTASSASAPPASLISAVDASPSTFWPAPEENAIPARDLSLGHEDSRTVEIGVGWFVMTNAGVGAVMGPTPFVVLEAGHGIFIRPSLLIGDSTSATPTSAFWMSGRVDACGRIPGLYSQDRGIQLDMCLGSDVGAAEASTATMPYVAVGPSVDLRGDLAGHLAAAVRGAWGLNLTSGTSSTSGIPIVQPLGSGRLELAFSWKVR